MYVMKIAAAQISCAPGDLQANLAKVRDFSATTNRNFRGRMGSRDAEVHLANAYVAAASAVAGEIIDPAELGA